MEKSAAAFLAAAALAVALGQAGKAAMSGAWLSAEDALGEPAGAQASFWPAGGEPVDWRQTSLGAEAEPFMQ